MRPPGAAQGAPKRPQDAPKRPQDNQKCPQDAPKRPRDAPKCPQDTPKGPICSPKHHQSRTYVPIPDQSRRYRANPGSSCPPLFAHVTALWIPWPFFGFHFASKVGPTSQKNTTSCPAPPSMLFETRRRVPETHKSHALL